MPKLKYEDRPEELQRPEVIGVFVGGCVERGDGSRFRRKAHAHTQGTHKGWICVLSAKRLVERMLTLHELAHIITGLGHVDKWREKCLELGGTLDLCYDIKGKVLIGDCHKRRQR